MRTGSPSARASNIRPYAFLEALTPPGEIGLTVGDRTYLGHFIRITALGGVTIGNDVLISDRCYLSDTGHVYEDVTVPIKDQPLIVGRQIHIGDGDVARDWCCHRRRSHRRPQRGHRRQLRRA